MTPTVPRVLFAAASGFFAVSFIQDSSYIFRDEYVLSWSFYLGMVVTFIQSALLALPVFLVGKRVIAVISIVSVYFVQFLFAVTVAIRDLEYLFDFGIRGFFQQKSQTRNKRVINIDFKKLFCHMEFTNSLSNISTRGLAC